MEKQIVLTARLTSPDSIYFSKWSFNRRHVGSRSLYESLIRRDAPYEDERLSAKDIPLFFGDLIKWSE